jgi:multimeric flavodoxin WrbA
MRPIVSSILKNRTDFQPNAEVFGVSGSPRKNGNSDIILKTIISGVSQENISSDTLNLTNIQFQGCIGCEKCTKFLIKQK